MSDMPHLWPPDPSALLLTVRRSVGDILSHGPAQAITDSGARRRVVVEDVSITAANEPTHGHAPSPVLMPVLMNVRLRGATLADAATFVAIVQEREDEQTGR